MGCISPFPQMGIAQHQGGMPQLEGVPFAWKGKVGWATSFPSLLGVLRKRSALVSPLPETSKAETYRDDWEQGQELPVSATQWELLWNPVTCSSRGPQNLSPLRKTMVSTTSTGPPQIGFCPADFRVCRYRLPESLPTPYPTGAWDSCWQSAPDSVALLVQDASLDPCDWPSTAMCELGAGFIEM